jgi:amidase
MAGARAEPLPTPQEPIRVAWSDGRAFGPVRTEVTEVMARLAAAIAAAGHLATEQPGLFADCLPTYNRLRELDPMVDHAAAVAGKEDAITGANLETIKSSLAASPGETARARQAAVAARAGAIRQLESFDIALLPVAGGPAARVDGTLDIDGEQLQGWEIMGPCRAVTLTGCPVVSLPVGLSAEGLPLSVQVVAPPGGELAALAFAELLEHVAAAPG